MLCEFSVPVVVSESVVLAESEVDLESAGFSESDDSDCDAASGDVDLVEFGTLLLQAVRVSTVISIVINKNKCFFIIYYLSFNHKHFTLLD